MAGVNGFNGIKDPLPPVQVNGVNVTFAGHHGVSQSVFKASRFFAALKDEDLFDGRNWASNGMPLPNTVPGAGATGMALHRDRHPAYIAWQRRLFSDFEDAFENRDFGGLTESDWLKARAAEINGFKAYVQTELNSGDTIPI